MAGTPESYVGTEVRGVFAPPSAASNDRRVQSTVVFDLVRFVGAGKFAWVYEAHVKPTSSAPPFPDTRVAVKLLYRDDVQAVRRFQREIKVLRQLPAHPNAVAYKGHGAVDKRAWMAMDFIDGITLSSVLRSGRAIPERAACTLMAQLCDGFEGLHRLGLTHRDITPDNIMITQADRQVRIMDFGLVQDSQGLLQLYEQVDILDGKDFIDDLDAGLIAGTPEFMAPEQILDPHESDKTRQKTDTTADVFALGTIFYQLLSAQQLFPYERGARGASGKQALINFLDWRVRLRDDDLVCPPQLGAELWSIVRKSLAREPKLRQRDATELCADLRYYLETGQGVLEDDMSATIATEFDANRMKSLSVALSTGEFQTIAKAAAEGKAHAALATGATPPSLPPPAPSSPASRADTTRSPRPSDPARPMPAPVPKAAQAAKAAAPKAPDAPLAVREPITLPPSFEGDDKPAARPKVANPNLKPLVDSKGKSTSPDPVTIQSEAPRRGPPLAMVLVIGVGMIGIGVLLAVLLK